MMSGEPLPGDRLHGERFHHSRPGGAGLFWPSGRHLFRRRRATAARLAGALAVLGLAGVLAFGLSLVH